MQWPIFSGRRNLCYRRVIQRTIAPFGPILRTKQKQKIEDLSEHLRGWQRVFTRSVIKPRIHTRRVNFTERRGEVKQGLKFSLLNSWRVKVHVTVNFSKIIAWNAIRTPLFPPPPPSLHTHTLTPFAPLLERKRQLPCRWKDRMKVIVLFSIPKRIG